MADIFISYATEDRARAKALADTLESRGWTVWWDRKIPLGQSFDKTIEDAIAAARCSIVLWSRASIQSEWVRSEASEAKRRGILVPAFLEPVDPPLAFRLLSGADLSNWTAGTPHPELDKLTERVTEILANGGVPSPVGPPAPPRHDGSSKPGWLRQPALTAIALAVLVAGVVYGAYVIGRSGSAPAPSPAATPATPPSQSKPSPTASDPSDLPELEAAWKELLGGATTGAGRSSMLAVLKIIELGLHITFVTPEQAAAIGAAGAVVVRVDPGPAQNAGVRVGDVIAAINGRTISSRDDLLRVGRTIGPGTSRYSIRRDDKMLAVDIECPGCVAAGK